eukprot:9902538-Lingulodinium_polyedra.AAC.1
MAQSDANRRRVAQNGARRRVAQNGDAAENCRVAQSAATCYRVLQRAVQFCSAVEGCGVPANAL